MDTQKHYIADMRLIRFAGAALLATLVAATATATATATAGSAKKITCKVQLETVAAAGSTTRESLGTIACPSPFGKGRVHNSFTLTPTSKTTGTVSGRFKHSYDRGTISGTFKLTFKAGATGLKSSGTSKIFGGTGAYKHAKGSAKIACEASDKTHSTCTDIWTLTHS